LVSWLRR